VDQARRRKVAAMKIDVKIMGNLKFGVKLASLVTSCQIFVKN